MTWLTSSKENYATLFGMAEVWDMMDRMSLLADLFPLEQRIKRPRKEHWKGALAATLAIIASFGLVLILQSKFDEPLSDVPAVVNDIYQTDVGEILTADLSDGFDRHLEYRYRDR